MRSSTVASTYSCRVEKDNHLTWLFIYLPDGESLRVQCKNARWDRGCVVFNGRTTDHGRGRLAYRGLADAFGVFEPMNSGVYLLPVADVPGYEGHPPGSTNT
jgi:hypothetical protein